MIKKAYAKINLMLKVVSKREDGYHNLQMLNTKINLYDEVVLEKALNDEVIYINNENISSQFIMDVIKCFKRLYNKEDCFKITIHKHIPVGAGLGGGSMDAGAVIELLYDYYQLSPSNNEKISKFKHLGADIPYAFYNNLAFVEGIGDIITPIDYIFNTSNLILVYPNICLSTPNIFKANNIFSPNISLNTVYQKLLNNDISIFANDLEQTAFLINENLKQLKIKLQTFGHTWMSGSGSCFVLYAKEDQKEYIYDKIKKEFPEYFIFCC